MLISFFNGMGYFITLKTEKIAPIEFTRPTRRRLIYAWWLIDSYLNGYDDTIISPAVKPLKDDLFVTVDGHHRLLVADLFKGESRVYVPHHKRDFFTEATAPGISEFSRKDLNYTIEQCFDAAGKVNYLKEGTSFKDLRHLDEFQFLRNIGSAKAFYNEWKPIVDERRAKSGKQAAL
jgi:hypothetical protein